MEKEKDDNNKNEGVITRFWTDKGYLSLLEYEAKGGFSVLKDILAGEITASEIISELEDSGLQGRGGGGFSTGLKWRLGKENSEKAKKLAPPAPYRTGAGPAEAHAYFICNADESEPGTYKDRIIIENSPYLVLEGMLIGAWVLGAEKGYIYINNCYKSTQHILQKSISTLEQAGWLGENIQGSGFSFQVELFPGAGSYICGEETALINTIEGKRG